MLNEMREQQSVEKVTKCPECGHTDLIEDAGAGELVCERCGVVITSMLFNQGPEWRAFNHEQRDKRTRVGAPSTWTIHDKGLSTIIDWRGKDAYGRRLKPERRAQAYRLRKWNRRSKVTGSSERNLAYALSELTKITFKLNLPKSVLETSSVIYRQLVRKRLMRGRSIKAMAAATLYMACRQCKVIRTLSEVGRASSVSKKEVGRNYRFLLRKLETQVPPAERESYLSKYVNQLILSGDVENLAAQILDQAAALRLTSGRSPSGITAAALYIATKLCDECRTQGQIARGAQVTEVTIRNRYKELAEKISFEIDL